MPSTIIGHSWGGRIALRYSAMMAQQQQSASSNQHHHDHQELKSLWLLDTVPGQVNDSVEQVISAIENFQANHAQSGLDKKAMLKILIDEYQLSMPLAQWLISSFDIAAKQFMFDFQVAQDMLPEFQQQDFYGLINQCLSSTESMQIHLVRGGKNQGWTVDVLQQLNQLQRSSGNRFHVHVLPKAGHWVHIDDRDGLVRMIQDYSS